MGLLLAPLQVFVRDVRQVVTMAIGLGFWLTPVFYRRTQVPDSLSWLYDINPMARLIEAIRAVLLVGVLPSLEDVGVVAAAAAIALALGWAVFTRLRDAVPEQL